MKMHLVLAVTSTSAFLEIDGEPIFLTAIKGLMSVSPASPLRIAVGEENAPALSNSLHSTQVDAELLICDPNSPPHLAEVLLAKVEKNDSVMFHDASRPFTPVGQFQNIILALNVDVDAVRPAMPYTETLKFLDSNSVIQRTLDRSTVFRISTPELIRVSAIDISGPDCGWFLPLKSEARTLQIVGSLEGMRINSPDDRDLIELHNS